MAFILGALISTLSRKLGMKIATYANGRSTFEACRGVQKAFKVAFQSGSVMGFLPTAILSVKLFFKDDMPMRLLLVMVLVDPQ